jgi:hypothetical protein
MARPARSEPTKRLNLEMAETVRLRLENLREHTEADSLTEVVRRALLVYEFLWAEKLKGSNVVIRNSTGDKELIIL